MSILEKFFTFWKKTKLDPVLTGLFFTLLTIGLIMLYSASAIESYYNFSSTSKYILNQFQGVVLGLVGAIACYFIPYKFWHKVLPVLLLGSVVSLILVKIPGIGISFQGASRWINLGFTTFQPTEIVRIVVIIYIAAWLSRKNRKYDFFSDVIPPLVVLAVVGMLVLWQPDMGSMLSILLPGALLLFIGGVRLKYLAGLTATAIAGLLILIKIEPYRMERFVAFINPEHDPLGISYQINQAIIGIGSAGWWGYGYGDSRQKYHYLPEAIGDSVFAVVAQELGFVRVVLILLLFVAYLWYGIRLAQRISDPFGRYCMLGILFAVGISAGINIAAITGLLPLTGIPLPFFSYGSSAILSLCVGFGIMSNIIKSNLKQP